jgi:uncharacterized protein (TIGR03435 family)
MESMDDSALLRQYCDKQSEEAFEALVTRYINLVHSAALRQLGNPQHAEEVTQAVFILLAKKASGLRHEKALSSWLFRTAHLVSKNFLRSEMRRHHREQEAFMQSTANEPGTDAWQQMSPLLDTAVAALDEKDRQAILLRFFQKKSLSDVGVTIGIGEEAAKKRVSRALEKLRKFFAKRGVSSTTTVIGENISAHSVQAAPVALAKAVATVAVAKGVASTASTLTLVKGALKVMAWSKAKPAVGISLGVLLIAGATITTVKEVKANEIYPWQVPKADFKVFYKMEPAVKIVPTKFAQSGGICADSTRGAMGIAQPLDVIIGKAYQESDLRIIVNTDLPKGRFDFIAKLVPAQEEHKRMATNDQWAVELQKEIIKQFGIKGAYETRDTKVLLLRPVSSGTRGFKVSHTMRNGIAVGLGSGDHTFFAQPVGVLAFTLEQDFKLPVVDKTGLTETYNYALKWDEPDPKQPNLEGMKQALADQLGLELVPTNMPMQMLVIEKVK